MSDYSDIIFLTAAMVVFGMLTVNTARSFQVTSDTIVRSELEYRAIAVAQDEIDAIRWLEDEDLFDSGEDEYLYGDDPIQKSVTYGSNNQYSETFSVTRTSTEISNDSNGNSRYKIQVTVQSNAISPPITGTLSYIKTFEN